MPGDFGQPMPGLGRGPFGQPAGERPKEVGHMTPCVNHCFGKIASQSDFVSCSDASSSLIESGFLSEEHSVCWSAALLHKKGDRRSRGEAAKDRHCQGAAEILDSS